jgi:uncharacterized protein (DUF488 family)
MTPPTLYTVGHSNHSLERFLELLRLYEIEAVADVRSHPYSQFCPHFNREALETALAQHGVRYAFMGWALGARTDDRTCYENGQVKYERLAETAPYQAGIRRLKKAMETRRVALMCAEKDPLTCHRTILITRRLQVDTAEIRHILETGEIETQGESEQRLLDLLKIQPSLFFSEAELIAQAYEQQESKIAYRLPSGNRTESVDEECA